MASSTEPQKTTSSENKVDYSHHTQAASPSSTDNNGISWTGRLLVFLVVPSLGGFLGIYFSYLKKLKEPSHEISVDQDLIMPFLLSLAMVIIVWVQTSGFQRREPKPLVSWPKVKRVKKIVKRKKERDNDSVERMKDK